MKVLLAQAREQPWKLRWDNDSFRRSLKLPQSSLRVINIFGRKLSLRDFDGYDAVIIGGSKYGIYDKVPNMNVLRQFIKRATSEDVPLLGVCFGAQLIAQTLHGRVVLDEKNQEFGTFVMEKTNAGSADQLFSCIPKKFLAQCAHHDRIVRAPKGSVILAKSRKCPVQAFRVRGSNIYGVQFHPERSRDAYMMGLAYELNHLPKAKRELKNLPLKIIMKQLRPSQQAEKILKNFLQIVKRRAVV